ncbi:MAG: tRNA preQ1(34) S-adenosylmethionine ribosyltransferase-isomerase QueA [Rhizomicrobium sp.]
MDQFDFDLPEDLIALRPAAPRDSARLLVVGPDGALAHRRVRDLPALLAAGDTLVLNDTKVISARLRGVRSGRGATAPKIEVMLHKRLAPDRFLAFARPARKLEAGDSLLLGASLAARVCRKGEGGEIEVAFETSGAALDAAIAIEGEIPLPPYIAGKRKPDDRDLADYQTVYAAQDGSVAAPTAGLHFTSDLFDALHAQGIGREMVTLHVGAGTFLPVSAEDTAAHRMHAEWASVSARTAQHLNVARARGGRTVAVGTTSLRTLESAARDDDTVAPFEGETDIFILPGYRFRAVDVLLTNFHLPRSTLFMLVSAFCGGDVMKAAYAEAIRERYRFYSYGDACLLFRPAIQVAS